MIPVKVKINGHKFVFRSRHELARYLMDLLNDSVSTLLVRATNLQKIMEITGFPRKAEWIGGINTEDRFTKAYWETLLSLEHKGTLRGFSVICSIEKGSSNFNPEKKRITENWTIK